MRPFLKFSSYRHNR